MCFALATGAVWKYANAMRIIGTETAHDLPVWRRPIALLFLFAFAMPIAFNTWSALLNNFVIEAAGFTGIEIGWLQPP